MIKYFLILFMCLSYFTNKAQITKADYYNTIDNKVFTFSKQKSDAPFDTIVAFVNSTFSSQEDRARAYYTWTALNISYDIDHMNEINLIKTFNINSILSSNQKAGDVLKNKKAVCEGYSNLMVQFCRASSIPCFIVCGYTKNPDGEIPQILHAWNVLRIDSAWTMLDITWSSGYVNPLNKFVKRFSNTYFMTRPKTFIKDHFPLDPMWQLLKNPFTKHDFEKDSLVYSNTPTFNFPDSIRFYSNQSERQQQYLNFLHYYRADPTNRSNAYNLDVVNNNLAVDRLNTGSIYQEEFMEIALKKLSKTPTLSDCKKARAKLDSTALYLNKAQTILTSYKPLTPEYISIFADMQKSIDQNMNGIKTNYGNLNKLQASFSKKK